MNLGDALLKNMSLENYLGNDLPNLQRQIPDSIIQERRQLYVDECGLACSGYRTVRHVESGFVNMGSQIKHAFSILPKIKLRQLPTPDDNSFASETILNFSPHIQILHRLFATIQESVDSVNYERIVAAINSLLKWYESILNSSPALKPESNLRELMDDVRTVMAKVSDNISQKDLRKPEIGLSEVDRLISIMEDLNHSRDHLKCVFLEARECVIKGLNHKSLPSLLISIKSQISQTLNTYLAIFHDGIEVDFDRTLDRWIIGQVGNLIRLIETRIINEQNLEVVQKLALEVSKLLAKYGADFGAIVCGCVERAVVDRFAGALDKIKDFKEVDEQEHAIIDAFNQLKMFCPIGAASNVRRVLSENAFVTSNPEMIRICDSAMELLFDQNELAALYGLSLVRHKRILNNMVYIGTQNEVDKTNE